MIPSVEVLIAWLLGLLLGFALALGRTAGRGRRYGFQNHGEARLTRALQARFPPPDYHLLNHLTLPARDGTTQVDHVLVSRFGVFVIETKDYKGWIFADARARTWTQVLYRMKFRFQNPLHQNDLHLRAIQRVLDILPVEAIVPVVVFTGTAEFRTPIPDGVFTLQGFLAYLEGQRTEVLSVNRLQFCVGRLETTRLALTRTTDVEHVEQLRRRFGHHD